MKSDYNEKTENDRRLEGSLKTIIGYMNNKPYRVYHGTGYFLWTCIFGEYNITPSKEDMSSVLTPEYLETYGITDVKIFDEKDEAWDYIKAKSNF